MSLNSLELRKKVKLSLVRKKLELLINIDEKKQGHSLFWLTIFKP